MHLLAKHGTAAAAATAVAATGVTGEVHFQSVDMTHACMHAQRSTSVILAFCVVD